MKFATIAVAASAVCLTQAHVAPRQLDPNLLLQAPKAFLGGLTACFAPEADGLEYLRCVTDNTLNAVQAVVKLLPGDIQESVSGVLDTAKQFEKEIKECVKEESAEALKDCVQGKLKGLEKEAADENKPYIKAIDAFSEDVYKCSQGPGAQRLKGLLAGN